MTEHHLVVCTENSGYEASLELRKLYEAGAVQMNGRSSDILRHQLDGNWLIALDNPWGTNIVA